MDSAYRYYYISLDMGILMGLVQLVHLGCVSFLAVTEPSGGQGPSSVETLIDCESPPPPQGD